jgi:hypothetical protein
MAESNFDADLVGVGKGATTGHAFVAPKGTALPTDAKTALAATYKSMGYVSDAGLTSSSESSTVEIKDWSGKTIKQPQTSYAETYKTTFLENSETVLKAYYGDDNVTVGANGEIVVKRNGAFGTERVIVFEMMLTETIIRRIVIPRAVVTERDDITYSAESAVGYGVTIMALADAEGNCSYVYDYDSSAA